MDLDPETTTEELDGMTASELNARFKELYQATYGGSCSWIDTIANHLSHVI